MARDNERGSFAAEVPADLIAEALAAVEKNRPATAEEPPAALEQLRAQLAEEHDLRLRAVADLDNFRKRLSREREEVQRFGVERLVRDLLPALDNLDRALVAAQEGPVALGVTMTRRLLEDTLARHGVTSFAVEPGTPFDPNLHHALMTVETQERPAGTVVTAGERGYRLHDRLLRPAAVVVAAAPKQNTGPSTPLGYAQGERE